MPSLKGFLNRKYLEYRLEQAPIVKAALVPGTDITVSFVVHTWFEHNNRAQGSYVGEPDMVDWLKRELRDGDVFWDIGANVGAYSLLAAKLCPGARVFAFEPFIANFAHLWENIVLNEVSAQVFPVNAGLLDHTAPEKLAVSDTRAGSSHHQVGEAGGKVQQGVLCFRGGDVPKLLGLPVPTLLKLDIDGLEIRAIEGLRDVIANPTLRQAMVEIEKGKTEEPVQKIFEAEGFRRLPNPLTHATGGVFNALFARDAQGAGSRVEKDRGNLKAET